MKKFQEYFKESQDDGEEERTYKIYGLPDQLDELEEVFVLIEHLGQIGSSRTIKLNVDGDGRARLEIKKEDKKIKSQKEHDIDGNLEFSLD